jgi:ABC-type transporter Mla subunit MlaD
MNLDEFESQTRDSLERALNQLQTATLLLSALELQILESGNTIKTLSRVVETFVTNNRGEDGASARMQ